MFKSVKRLFLIILTVILITSTLVSCGGGVSEADALAAFNELYNKSVPINEYIFGKGLPYDNPESYDIESLEAPYYVAVSESSPYKTIEEFKAAVLEVYSSDYYNVSLRQGLFDGYGENSKERPRYIEEKGVLKIDITKTGLDITGTFDTAAAKMKSSSSGEAVIRAPWSSGETVREYDLVLVLENGVWRLDTPTY